MICRLCRTGEAVSVRKLISPYYEVEFTLYRCRNCSSLFVDPKEQAYNEVEMYEQMAMQNIQSNEFTNTFVRNRYWAAQVKMLLGLVKKPVKSVLDVGCRTGDFLMHFDKSILREGVELSENYANIANNRGLKVYNDYQENIKFDRQYDIVSAYAIVEHVVQPAEFIQKLASLVETDGILIIMVPTFQCIKEKLVRLFHKRWHMYSPPAHLNFLSRYFLDSYLLGENLSLIHRSYRSGGMSNPFGGIWPLESVFGRFMGIYDESIFNRLPIYDHMYSVYRKKENGS